MWPDRGTKRQLVVRPSKHGKVLVLRWREDVLQPDGTVKRVQRAETVRDASSKQRQRNLQARVGAANQGQRRPQAIANLSDFVGAEWRPNAELALKRSTVRYYTFQLDRYVLPVLGPTRSAICPGLGSNRSYRICDGRDTQRHDSRRSGDALGSAAGCRRAAVPRKESGPRHPPSRDGS